MSTLKGVLSVLLLEAMYCLIPPDHDPAFMALSKPLQIFTLIALAALGMAAFFFFASGLAKDLTNRSEPSPADRGGER